MTDRGYIKAFRSIDENPALRKGDERGVWLTLLLRAAWRPVKVSFRGSSIALRTGQYVCSVNGLADELGYSRKRVRTILARFVREGMVQVARQTSPESVQTPGQTRHTFGTLITVVKFVAYQGVETERESSRGQTSGQVGAKQGPTEQEVKNLKKDSESEGESVGMGTRAQARARKPRGFRIPTDWSPSDLDLAYARKQGLEPDHIGRAAERFRNFFLAKSGPHAVKADWSAAWRLWVDEEVEKVILQGGSHGFVPAGPRADGGGHEPAGRARRRKQPGSVVEAARRLLHRQT